MTGRFLVIHTEGAATILIHLVLNVLLLRTIQALPEIRELVPVRGEILIAEEDNLVFVLRIGRSSKPGHDEFWFQNIPMSRKESLRNVCLLARFFADSGSVVVQDHRMLILEASEPRRVRNSVLVRVI